MNNFCEKRFATAMQIKKQNKKITSQKRCDFFVSKIRYNPNFTVKMKRSTLLFNEFNSRSVSNDFGCPLHYGRRRIADIYDRIGTHLLRF